MMKPAVVYATPPPMGPLYRAAALRRSARGDTLPGRTLCLSAARVDRAHLAEYARVCGFRQCDELPATYPHVLAFPLAMALMTARDFPFPILGLVHVANRIEQRRPIRADEPLTLFVHTEHLRPHDRGTQLDLVATATVDDEEVWTDRSTYLRKSGTGEKSGKSDQEFVDGNVWRIPGTTGKDYAAVSADRNPIHTSRILARAFGFGSTIAHGMWTKARCLAALEGRLPDAYAVDVAFKLPILLPATVAFRARPGTDGHQWRFDVHDRRTGKPHLTGAIVDPDCADPDEGARAA